MKFDRVSPITNEIASSAQAMKPEQMAAIAAKAAAAFPIWSAMGPNARPAVLMKAADGLEAWADAFVDAIMSEIGSTKGFALFNVDLAANVVCEAAAITTQISGEVRHGARRCYQRGLTGVRWRRHSRCPFR
jgi:benzaldehyde dehydrogenase (NAD)